MATKADLEKYLQNPNVRKMLDLISYTEGTQKHGAATAFGGGKLGNLSDHPRYSKRFKQSDGTWNNTSAAGKYQFLKGTWDGVAKQYGLSDFGAHNQDLAAVALLVSRGAMPALLKGDFNTAVQKTGKEWANLPSAPAEYKQGKKKWAQVNDFLAGKGVSPTSSAPEPMNAQVERPGYVAPSYQNFLGNGDSVATDMLGMAQEAAFTKEGQDTPILKAGNGLAAPSSASEFDLFANIAAANLPPEQESNYALAASAVASAQDSLTSKSLFELNPLAPALGKLFDMVDV